MEVKDVILKMQELGIAEIKFNFMCGGDSMGDTNFEFHNSNGDMISEGVGELESYFEDEVYRNVEFYEASDGHYCGEAGHVEITINDEGDNFDYIKYAESEWSESVNCKIEIELTDKEVEFIKNNVSDINGGEGEVTNVNFSRDFIMTNEDEETLKSIIEKVDKGIEDCEPNYEGEPQEWFNFSTETLTINGNILIVNGEFYEYIYKSE